MDDDAGLGAPEPWPEPWFEPKRYGYGAGLPIVWQGWALMGGFMAATLVFMLLFTYFAKSGSLPMLLPVAAMIVAVRWVVRTCERHRRGGWTWRWGGKN